MCTEMVLTNPKLRGPESIQSTWYRYYPGFSERFVRSLLLTAGLDRGNWVLDPWNGSGTTSATAISLGLNAYGYDLNPVMLLAARARSLGTAQFPSLRPLFAAILQRSQRDVSPPPDDPLLAWFYPRSVATLRSIETAIQRLLVDERRYAPLRQRSQNEVSDLAAFFYVALFRTLRQIVRPLLTSNPTWVKKPASAQERLRPGTARIRHAFSSEMFAMLPDDSKTTRPGRYGRKVLGTESSEDIPLGDASVDIVVGSPPYCTRIDYGVATSLELALLGYKPGDLRKLRQALIGTTTVPKKAAEPPDDLGETCLGFLGSLKIHSSKASSTYYFKNHLQYFLSISRSMSEIGRVLKPGGNCILVVQDSFYKDLHNDLPQISLEMARIRGLLPVRRRDFLLPRTLAGINPRANGYRDSAEATESVLVLRKG